MENQTISYWQVPIEGQFTDNKSETLCILLPGVGYLLDRSYFDYSRKIADLELHMDIYEVEYGFQRARKPFNIPEEFNILAAEIIPSILQAIQKPYKHYVIIAKSIGTCIQILLNDALKNKNATITNVCISPINQTVSMGIIPSSLVLTGLSDPLLSRDSLTQIRQIPNIHLVTIEGANHSLDIPGNMFKTIDILKQNIMTIKAFID